MRFCRLIINSYICGFNFKMNNIEIKEKIVSSVYKISKKRGRSKIWDCFGFIKDENGIEIPGFVVCKMCHSVHKYHKKALSNLSKHKCYLLLNNGDSIEPNKLVKKACTDVLTEWVLGDVRPYSLVKDNGLVAYSKLLLSLGGKFGTSLNVESLIPHPTTIQKNVETSYSIHFEKLKAEISYIRETGYAMTSDLWTDNFSKISYLALTAHYVVESEYKSKMLGIKSMKEISNTSINIMEKMDTLLSEFNCSLNDPIVMVTNRGSNIKPALKGHENIYCINHLINNTIEECIKAVTQVEKIVAASSKLVKFIKKSGLNCDSSTSMKSFSPTSWNSAYFMMLSIKSNFNNIRKTLIEKNLTEKYTIINENHLDQLISILKPFIDASNELEGSTYATIHLVLPHIQNLKAICNSVNNDNPSFISEFKKKLYDNLISLVDDNLSIYHKLAIFLFPPANKLIQFNLEEQTEVLTKCKSLLLPYLNHIKMANTSIETYSSKIYSLFEKYVEPIEIANSSQSMIENEIIKYKNINIPLQNDFQVLKWWNERKNEFPLLHKLSCRLFAIPASSAYSERIFDIARPLITDKRYNEKSFNEILFVNINSKD